MRKLVTRSLHGKRGIFHTDIKNHFFKGMTAMKKLTTLLLAAGMIFAASAPASAVDVKMDGQYLFNFITGEYAGTGQNFDKAGQRLRLGMTFTANENLSGYFQVQVGSGADATNDYDWGSDVTGRETKIGMRQLYIDWLVPQTSVKVRMGRQLVGLPEDASVSYTHLRAHETKANLVCRLLLEKKKK